MVTIYDVNGNVLLELDVNDTSSSYRSIDGRHELTLKYSLSNPVELPIGAWCLFQNERFELMSHQDVKMKHSKHYEYTLVMNGSYGLLSRFKIRNIIDGRLKFDMVAKPSEFLDLIIANLNERDGGWTKGECIEADEKLISFNHTYCNEALNSVAGEFDTEFEVIGKQISLKKVEYNKENPLMLAYGKGNGLKPGVGRTNYEDGLPAVTMFVQGGSRNISYKDYGAIELHLPKSYSFKFDGEKFEGEEGYDSAKAREFTTDHLGSSVSILNGKIGREDSIDLSEIYPSRVGHVSKVVFQYNNMSYPVPDPSWTEDQWNDVQVDIFDNSIPEDLDFNDCLMENNEPLVVAFQSGELAGRDFDATFVKKVNVFELKKQEYSGQPMPQGVFVPKVGDSYAVFNVSLPSSYVSDIQTHSGAEFDALREATRALYEKSDPRFTFSGEVDEIWSKKNWENVGGKLKIGSYVSFVNEEITTDGPILVRIIGITQNVNNPHCPKIELSNVTHKGSVSYRISQIEDREAHVEELHKEAKNFTKRRFSDAQRSIKLLEKAFGESFTESIKPATVQTMMMLVGDESLQYEFVDSRGNKTTHNAYFDADTKVFHCDAGRIKHFTIGVKEIRSKLDQSHKQWSVNAFDSAVLDSTEKDYYVYAVVSQNGTGGNFELKGDPVGLTDVTGKYYLLLGLLLAENSDNRDFLPLYGFTQILPGQITTDVIRSADGKTYFDLANSEIGGRITFASGSSGLTNLDEWSGVQSQIDKANEDALKAQKEAEEAYNAQKAFAEQTTKELEGLQDQIDGNITSWFYNGVPTLSNAPAKDWNTTDLKNNHLGDLYYDQNSGKAYRFQMNGTAYEWKLIADEDISKALSDAKDAQDTADAKRRVFFGTSTPTGEKDKGDLWTNGTDLYVWNGTSWEKATKYTDDTTANAAISIAETAQNVANEVSEKIDGDNYFTEIEKKTIRSIIAEITECREKLYENNAIVKFTTKQGHSWYLVKEDSYAEWTDANEDDHSVSQSKYAGYYSSNLHNANSYSVTQVDVELTEGREVDIQLDYFSDAESTNDWMTVGARGTTVSPANTTTTSNTIPNRAGSTYGKQRMVFSKVYNITQEVDAEKRYFQVAYKKNATIDVGTDSAYFRISNPHYIDESGSLHIIELKGSFHRYYLLLKQKGYTEVADMLYDALTEILGHLNANGLWTSGTTELTDGEAFRATLNEYLTDYYAILASCGFDIMDSKLADFDYLAGALKDGSKTLTDGGLIMTSLVAVGDTSTTNADVEAFMNGSDFCEDNEHGKLIHAMGIPRSVTEEGTEYTDLEKRSKAANTRIYEDGTIISKNVILEDGCKIGNLSIKYGGIGIFDGCSEIEGVTTYGISIRQQNIQMASYRNNGSLCLLPTITNLSHSGLTVIKTTDDTDTQPAIDINIPEDRKAFSCSKGLVEGLRTNVKVITSAGTSTTRTPITELDFSVLLPAETSSATFFLRLPAIPPLGQEYLIESRGAGMNIVASQKIFNTSSGATTSASSQFTQSGRCLMRFKYYGSSYGWSATRIDY